MMIMEVCLWFIMALLMNSPYSLETETVDSDSISLAVTMLIILQQKKPQQVHSQQTEIIGKKGKYTRSPFVAFLYKKCYIIK